MVWPEMLPELAFVLDDDELQAAATTASEAAAATEPARRSPCFLKILVIFDVLSVHSWLLPSDIRRQAAGLFPAHDRTCAEALTS